MSEALQQYIKLTRDNDALLASDGPEDRAAEDALCDQLDVLWNAMSDEDRAYLKRTPWEQ